MLRNVLLVFSLLVLAACSSVGTTPSESPKVQQDKSTVLITGSNRGIGFEFVKQYADKGWNVIATSRKPQDDVELQALAAQKPNILIEKLDVTSEQDITALAQRYQGIPIDVLINNAGVLGDYEKQKVGGFEYSELDWVIDVNVKGPLRVSTALLDNVAASEQKKIVTLASALGSITMGPMIRDMYWYKASKAAMSITMASLNKDLADQGITVLRLGPGMVKTDLLEAAGAYDSGIPPEQAIAGMIKVIEKADNKMARKSWNYDGRPVPN